MTFQVKAGNRTGLLNQNILDTAMFAEDPPHAGGGQFLEKAKLSELFFEQLKRHPVPIEEAAISSIANNSAAIDVYCWLAYRLHALVRRLDDGPGLSGGMVEIVEPGIGVCLQDPAIAREMPGGVRTTAVAGGVEQGGGGCRATKWPIVAHVGPEPADRRPGFGQHRHRGVVAVDAHGDENVAADQLHRGASAAVQAPTQSAKVETSSAMPSGQRSRSDG